MMNTTPIPDNPQDRKKMLIGITVISLTSFFLLPYFEHKPVWLTVLITIIAICIVLARLLLPTDNDTDL